MTPTTSRRLGSRSVKIRCHGSPKIIASQSRPWIPMTRASHVPKIDISMPMLHADAPTSLFQADDSAPLLCADDPTPPLSTDDPDEPNDPRDLASLGIPSSVVGIDSVSFADPEDPELPPGRADVSPSSSLFDSRASSVESDDEDTLDEVQQMKKAMKAKKKTKLKVCPNPPGSSLSDTKSLQRLWRKCGISEES
ncbi:hypothetical protein AALP_AA1G347900 [Arabis alpina]|uniref:Uncharacterized protein n=1 Tax=Arabis alpina TaxID=50452 RepID=A0A087HSN0_ARAAL|nr:hypothetical protein AALP_AA1G347900 [Arabis alpina]